MFYLSFPIYYLRAKAGSNFAALIAGMIPPNNAVIIDVKTAIIVAVYGYSGMDIGVSIGKKSLHYPPVQLKLKQQLCKPALKV